MLLTRHVAVIGGGFSGTLLAINLLRDGGVAVTLIERDAARLARGLAYGAAQAGHILNVRAANMSAFADEPDHFVDWLAQRGAGSETSFASRTDYGTYLAALLAQARRAAPERLTIVQDEAVDLEDRGDDMLIRLRSGEVLAADHVVIASGNLPPHDLPAFAGLAAPAYVSDPWSPGSADGLGDDDIVMLLGTGLTAVDCALTLDHCGFRGRIVALSRRGLAPRRHGPADPFMPINERPGQLDSRLVRTVRARSRAIGWRNAVDELRPFTRDIWDGATSDQRARFLRHLRPYWDIHRHRIAPPVAERIDGMMAQGRLDFMAGKIVGAHAAGDGLEIAWRPRGQDGLRRRHVRRLINCTGPLGDLRRTTDPLLRCLAAEGVIRPDALAIGIDVDRQERAVTREGKANRRLFVVGPMTRGAHWEMVAVPDIRTQVWSLARYLTSTHWVGGEGL